MQKTNRQRIAKRLRQLEVQRQTVTITEQALETLSPQERMVVDMMLTNPERGNLQRLCQMLRVEKSSIYRYRDQALEKLEQMLLLRSGQ